MSELLELMKSRKSVRSFDPKPLTAEDTERLARYIDTVSNPFGIPLRFVLLDAKEHGLSSPVLSGETMYAAATVRKGPHAELAFGYSFEKLVLFAWSLGIGTTWIGGTMKRELFERAAALSEGELMPCISPLGYPAKKQSVRETVMRKAVGADSRMPAEKLFFDREWSKALTISAEDANAEPLEMVRWAPSAVNKQPWRIIVRDDRFHFYKKQDKGYISEKTGDLQKVDLGIALCHFFAGMEAQGAQPELEIRDPGIPVPEGAEYIATVLRKK